MSNEMKLRVWGVRGSYPTPGAGTVKIHIEQAERDVILAVFGAGDIADLVGASRKRVNQAMVLFKEQGSIDTDAEGRIAIKDGEGLARYRR